MNNKFDKNGIRILDSGTNNLPKECHPSLHQWEEDMGRQVAQRHETIELIPVRCTVCGKKDLEAQTY